MNTNINVSTIQKFSGIQLEGNVRSSIDVSLKQSHVEVTKDKETKSYELSKLDVELGGNNQSLIFFKFKGNENKSFYIHKSRELISLLKSLNHQKYNSILVQKRNNNLGIFYFYSKIIVALVIFVSAFILMKNPTISWLVDHIPQKYEEYIGDKLIGLYLPPSKLISDEKLTKPLEKLIKPLKESYKDLNVRFYISKDSELNAFALPGGHIVFNLGMLKEVESAEEILGVAAHELAHVSERHVVKGILQSSGMFLAIQTIFGDMTGLIAVLSENGAYLLSMSFSRDHEIQADNVGFDKLVQSNVDPRGMSDFFERLKEKRSDIHKEVEENLSFLTTHPQTQERILNIKKKYDALGADKKKSLVKIKFDLKTFKKNLNKY